MYCASSKMIAWKSNFCSAVKVAAQQRIIRDDQIVLGNLFAQIVPRRAAFEDEHLHFRRELLASRRQLCSTEAGQITSAGFLFCAALFDAARPATTASAAFCQDPCHPPGCLRA